MIRKTKKRKMLMSIPTKMLKKKKSRKEMKEKGRFIIKKEAKV